MILQSSVSGHTAQQGVRRPPASWGSQHGASPGSVFRLAPPGVHVVLAGFLCVSSKALKGGCLFVWFRIAFLLCVFFFHIVWLSQLIEVLEIMINRCMKRDL